jgi:hypothetical protein
VGLPRALVRSARSRSIDGQARAGSNGWPSRSPGATLPEGSPEGVVVRAGAWPGSSVVWVRSDGRARRRSRPLQSCELWRIHEDSPRIRAALLVSRV